MLPQAHERCLRLASAAQITCMTIWNPLHIILHVVPGQSAVLNERKAAVSRRPGNAESGISTAPQRHWDTRLAEFARSSRRFARALASTCSHRAWRPRVEGHRQR